MRPSPLIKKYYLYSRQRPRQKPTSGQSTDNSWLWGANPKWHICNPTPIAKAPGTSQRRQKSPGATASAVGSIVPSKHETGLGHCGHLKKNRTMTILVDVPKCMGGGSQKAPLLDEDRAHSWLSRKRESVVSRVDPLEKFCNTKQSVLNTRTHKQH